MNHEKIPQHLKDTAEWCCWQYEQKPGKAKPDKIPKNPCTGGNASVNIPNTFSDFDTAIKAVVKFDGIGTRASRNLALIDLDHCVENSSVVPWAQTVIDHFPDAYVEISPSRTGIHIICKISDDFVFDKKAFYIKKGNYELYIAGYTNRFLTVTGDCIQNGNASVQDEGIRWLMETHMRREQSVTDSDMDAILTRDSYLSDASVLEKAMNAKNGQKLRTLWNGDISGYPSQSEADIALVSILAFYCNGNAQQIDRIYRTWVLARKKWDECHGAETYGMMTIRRAVSGMKEFYAPIIKTDAAENFDDAMHRLEELNPMDTGAYPWSDIGTGKLLADFYESVIRYVPKRKSWFYYEEGIWQQDVGGLKAMKYCMELANLLHMYALKITDEHTRKGYMEYAKRWQRHPNRVNILKDAQVYHPIDPMEFDSDIHVFNCSNCTLHLDTRSYTEHRSEDKLTKISPVVYDPDVYCERWEKFIDEIMSGDKEKAKFMQKLFGYGLTGDTHYECLTILYGASTRNGKSTLCEAVLKVLGGYGCTTRPETLAMKPTVDSSLPSEDIARLAGVRFVTVSEPGKGLVLNAAQLKTLTGNDLINARYLHENSFDFRSTHKFYVNTNYLPTITDMTVFASGRLYIIPFDRHFDEGEQDKGLKQYFSKPEVQSAIFNWLLEGYDLLQKEGLTPPPSVRVATAQYRHDSDKIALFFEDCMESGDAYEVRTSEVYYRYKRWCEENGHYAENMKNFKQSIAPIATAVRKRPKGDGEKTTVITGYRLISEFL